MFSETVKQSAIGQWDTLLQNIGGLSKPETTPSKKGMPCPHCGGTDRYEFKSVENGFYMCRGCGAGDGWSMLMKRLGTDFKGAVEQVAQHLGIVQGCNIKRPIPRPAKTDDFISPEIKTAENTGNKAQYIWNQSAIDPFDHPYLVRKHLPPLKLRRYHDCLVSQVYNPQQQLVNLQFIDRDGNKRFLRGGQTKGCFQWWGKWDKHGPDSWSIFICEGVADAISTFLFYHQSRITIAAYSASNMAAVGEQLRQRCHGHRLVLVLDNDTPSSNRKYRPGMASLVAHHCFDDIILPPEGNDASDIWVKHHEQY
ncbi:hypothetical protein NX722_05515 [Endozoicomonas gorgoniicola]|uniref:DNA primase/helicase Gp4 N-terminal Bacteriophage T7-like domain-containing protein n=1 Tax=Endozoicomonas gorgoniicola TaxID=1234144 RepID=A0ABT3MRW6_9GAMM|nr:primase-helicase zinc-binding domain-containing protein [Endozoicomonas gorgoniicola]MCW7552110.1 hypothetical protein [Endozoicomonas gorgoniicola]